MFSNNLPNQKHTFKKYRFIILLNKLNIYNKYSTVIVSIASFFLMSI